MPSLSSRPQRLDGLVWPLVPNSKKEGDRSTTWTNKQVFVAATKAAGDYALAEKILHEKRWRKTYTNYVYEHVATCLQSKEATVGSSAAGLKWAHNNFDFVRNGTCMKFSQAMSSITASFETGHISGRRAKPARSVLEVPYKNKLLSGKPLEEQVDRWVSYGTIESSAGEAIKDVSRKAHWRDLSDKNFVLLGASSAMGPLKFLLDLGANVIAIDLNRPCIWERLFALAENSCGTLTFPLTQGNPQHSIEKRSDLCAAAGANLLSQTPEILNWLKEVSIGKQSIVGSYAYLDGELHVRVSLAMDAIVKGLTEARSDIMPAYLCTPTDVHIVPEDVYSAAKKQYNSWEIVNMCCFLTGNGFGSMRMNAKKRITSLDACAYRLVDGLVNKQGPNYALAKRIQHWRAVVARQVHRCMVSSNIAPSTVTTSVVSNKLFALAYGGMRYFKPMEVFQQDTSKAVMGALLLRDVFDPATPSNPDLPLKNPLQLLSYGSFHGGVWRMAYTVDSIGTPCVLAYLLAWVLNPPQIIIVVLLVGFVVARVKNGGNPIDDVTAIFQQLKGEL